MDVLFSILAISGLAALLAALLVVAQRFILNYGECTITINKEKRLTVEGGGSLLHALSENKIFIPSACGGRGTCGYCKLKVLEGGGPIVPTEEPYLTKDDRAGNVRLSCQLKVRNDLEIQIPEHLFNVREFQGICTRIKDLTYDIKEFRIELKEPPEMKFTPGQYVQLFCPAYDDNEEVYRAYSIASDPAEKDVIELVIRLVPGGICTTWCFEHLQEGGEVRLNGPYGEFYLSETDAPIVFIAGGSGMAPIRCMLHQMKNTANTRPVVFFFGANTPRDLFYRDTMKEFETSLDDFTFVPVLARPEVDDAWDGETGLVTQAVEKHVKDAAGKEAYLCGSPGMIDASVDVLTKLGMPKESVFYDKFA